MISNDASTFWVDIERQFDPIFRVEQPTFVLSPAQARRYQLARLGVPKYKHLIEQPDPNFRVCIMTKQMFHKYFDELSSLGLIHVETLEPEYKKMLPPAFMVQYGSWSEIQKELAALIKKRELSERFAKLWSVYVRRNHIMLFVEYFDPYVAAAKSAEKNKCSDVEKYIFALWMHSQGYQNKKREKDSLVTDLSHDLDEILKNHKAKDKKPWQFKHYQALLKTTEYPLIRTVTDMNLKKITEYATDGVLNKEDFPQLFSAT